MNVAANLGLIAIPVGLLMIAGELDISVGAMVPFGAMTVAVILAGLLPIMWGTGTGSEVMQRIAVPMIGGMVSSTVLTLVVIPAVYSLVKGWGLSRIAAVPSKMQLVGGS